MALGGINKTPWGTKLLLTAVLACHVYCVSLCLILKTQHFFLDPNGCFNQPSAPYSPPPSTPSLIDSIQELKKLSQKPAASK